MNLTTVETYIGFALLALIFLAWVYKGVREEWDEAARDTLTVYYDLTGHWELIPWPAQHGALVVSSSTSLAEIQEEVDALVKAILED